MKVIAIVGPTSSGKSALGVFLAQKIGGEVISADSRQVYKGLDIGTGKITKKEMQGVPHHLLSIAKPKRQFSADDFVKKGSEAIFMIYHKKKLPIVVGGTGFYVDALLGRITLPNVAPNKKLRERLERKTTKELFNLLQKLDPVRAKTIEPEHKRRLIRAIEVAVATSTTAPVHLGSSQRSRLQLSPSQYKTLWLGLSPSPEKLKKKIHTRLNERLKRGMIAEAKKLHKQGLSYKRMEELGLEYRYLARYLRQQSRRKVGTPTIKLDASGLEREINKYARRQNKWFKRNKDIVWVRGKADALKHTKTFLRAMEESNLH